MGLSKEKVKRAKKEVKSALLMLAKAVGVKPVRGREMPEVEIVEKGDRFYGTNSFHRGDNKIRISSDSVSDGITYFEEASHALREIVQKRKGKHQYDDKVDEFYGRIGETIGRDLTKGTKLAYLFKNKSPRDMKSRDFKKDHRRMLRIVKEARSKIRDQLLDLEELKGTRERLEKITSGNYKTFRQTLKDFASGKLTSEEFVRRVKKTERNYLDSTGGIKSSKGDLKRTKYYQELFGLAEKAFKGAKDEKGKRKAMKKETKFLDKTYKRPIYHFGTEDINLQKLMASTNSFILQKQIRHRRAYLYGQQYSAGELEEVKGLYGLSDEETKKVFFHSKNPYDSAEELRDAVVEARKETRESGSFMAGPLNYVDRGVSEVYEKIVSFVKDVKRTAKRTLEEKVATLFFVSLAATFVYVLFGPRITGFAVYSSSNISIGGILGLVSLLLGMILYFKFKRSS